MTIDDLSHRVVRTIPSLRPLPVGSVVAVAASAEAGAASADAGESPRSVASEEAGAASAEAGEPRHRVVGRADLNR